MPTVGEKIPMMIVIQCGRSATASFGLGTSTSGIARSGSSGGFGLLLISNGCHHTFVGN
jgi:hypothetical protein